MDTKNRTDDPARNPDPITKAPGSHPVGTGIGAAAGGAAAGAAIGTVAGPVGTALGAAAGAIAGGLIGKGVSEAVNPTVEDAYWRENYVNRPYVTKGDAYDEYAPAYRYGWESRARYSDKTFEDVESDLERNWDASRGESKLRWDAAKRASRDAWDRVSPPSDAD